MRIVWLSRALDDRRRQLLHIAEDSPRAAGEQGDRIMSRIDMLADHPEMGRRGRVVGTRELVISGTPFIAVYRVSERPRRIEIIRLLHGAQKWPSVQPT